MQRDVIMFESAITYTPEVPESGDAGEKRTGNGAKRRCKGTVDSIEDLQAY